LIDQAVANLTSTGTNQPIVQRQVADLHSGNEFSLQTMQSSGLVRLDELRANPELADIDGRGFSVVIIDTGIDLDHPFFGTDADGDGIADRIVFNYDFSGGNDNDASDYDGHGSNVSSIVASSDSLRPGMASAAGIIHLKVFPDQGGAATTRDIEEALQWVVANAGLYNIASVNMSLGYGNFAYARNNTAWSDEFKALESLDVIMVAAAGNDYYELESTAGISLPAADPGVISVGAVFAGNIGGVRYFDGAHAARSGPDIITPFSQRHPAMLDVFAPGAPISGAGANGGLLTQHGTSQATPHVAGAAALAQQISTQLLGRRLTVDEFRHLLATASTTITDGDDENDNVLHSGLEYPRLDLVKMAAGIQQLQPGAIEGRVFHDLDADGSTATDPGLSGQLVYLDSNNNGQLDATTTSFDSTAASQVIADQSMLQSTILVEDQQGPLTDVNVRIDVRHSWNADLVVYLVSPQGTRVELISDIGNGQTDFRDTVFDDQARSPVHRGSSPYQGSYRPTESLGQLAGESAAGEWTLEVHDRFERDEGRLESWSLELSHTELSTRTGSSGEFQFDSLVSGQYFVRTDVPANWLMLPTAVASGGLQELTVTAGQTTAAVEFAYQTSLQIWLTDSVIREDDGPQATELVVSRQGVSLADDLWVTLVHNDASEIDLPGQVVIPAGADEVTVAVNTVDDRLRDGTQQVTITASSTGLGSDTAVLAVDDHELLTLTSQTSSVRENAGSAAIELLIERSDFETQAPLQIELTSSDSSELALPSSVLMAADVTSLTILVDVIDDQILDGTQQVQVRARAAGFLPAEIELNVLDYEPLQLAVDDHVAWVSATAGSNTLTINRNPLELADPLSVQLDWQGAVGLAVADQFVIPAGVESADLQIQVEDPGNWSQTRQVVVTAEASGYEATTARFWFSDRAGLHLESDQASVAENAGAAALTWIVSRAGIGTAEELTVQLSSSDTSELAVPDVIVIPATASSIEFMADVIDDHLFDGTRPVTVTARSDGLEQTSLVIEVSDYETWQNPVNPLDVDNNGRVTPSDVLALINMMEQSGSIPLPVNTLPENAPAPFLDVNGDFQFSQADMKPVVDHYNELTLANLRARQAEAERNRSSDAKQVMAQLVRLSLPQQVVSRSVVIPATSVVMPASFDGGEPRQRVFAETRDFVRISRPARPAPAVLAWQLPGDPAEGFDWSDLDELLQLLEPVELGSGLSV
jgi:subtilisin-like proprotein convertase family protein